jgi:carbon starvation protein
MVLNTVMSVVILVLVAIIIVDNVRVWLQLLKTEGPIGMNTEREIVYCPILPADRAPDDKTLA